MNYQMVRNGQKLSLLSLWSPWSSQILEATRADRLVVMGVPHPCTKYLVNWTLVSTTTGWQWTQASTKHEHAESRAFIKTCTLWSGKNRESNHPLDVHCVPCGLPFAFSFAFRFTFSGVASDQRQVWSSPWNVQQSASWTTYWRSPLQQRCKQHPEIQAPRFHLNHILLCTFMYFYVLLDVHVQPDYQPFNCNVQIKVDRTLHLMILGGRWGQFHQAQG